jgi:small GTP-binding protein
VNRPAIVAPPGLTLRHRLGAGDAEILGLAWSPDGQAIATGSQDGTIRRWDAGSGRSTWRSPPYAKPVMAIGWSPDGALLATGSADHSIRFWRAGDGRRARTLRGQAAVWSLAWSHDGARLASTGADSVIRVWNAESGELVQSITTRARYVNGVAWSPDGKLLAAALSDGTMRTWDDDDNEIHAVDLGLARPVVSVTWSIDGRVAFSSTDLTIYISDLNSLPLQELRGHTDLITSLRFSHDGGLLASKSQDGTVRLWNTATWDTSAILPEPTSNSLFSTLAFHPSEDALAITAEDDRAVHVWAIDRAQLQRVAAVDTHHYTNAKVVLVGDSGVGKSALGLVLSGAPYAPTESSHGRRVWTLDRTDHPLEGGRVEQREILLWDLAGQPGYRVFHRHHLNEVAVALVLFDSRSETDPFAGVSYWARALDEARRGFPLVKILVASRIDRGGPATSDARIREVCEKYGFSAVIHTSAARGDGIGELGRALREAIAWDRMPRISSPRLFRDMQTFLVGEKEAGRVLQTRGTLLDGYLTANKKFAQGEPMGGDPAGREAFDACLGRIEAAGLVKRLTFGDLALLQPEVLDDYCAWIALAARAEPDGLGFIAEDRARRGEFPMDTRRPLANREQERLLLAATVEDIVGRGIALRQPTDQGEMLVFPSELRTDMPDYPGSWVRAVTFLFEGPVAAIYATLAVRLAHAPAFTKERFFRNAALFHSAAGEACGFAVDRPDPNDDIRGRLTVFFDGDAAKGTKLTFLRYVNLQLTEMAYAGTLRRERVFQCDRCRYEVPPDVVAWRIERGEATVLCPRCGRHLPLDDLAEKTGEHDLAVVEQAARADEERERHRRLASLAEREQRAEFHVFLCHNSKEKPEVRQLAARLRDQGVLPWLDEESIAPGAQFVPTIEQALDAAPAVAVIVGPNWLGRWQKQEYYALFQRFVEQRFADGKPRVTIIPVLLPGAPKDVPLPPFLRGLNWIDFRKSGLDDRATLGRLVSAILGENPWENATKRS